MLFETNRDRDLKVLRRQSAEETVRPCWEEEQQEGYYIRSSQCTSNWSVLSSLFVCSIVYYKIVRGVQWEFPKSLKMASNEIDEGSSTEMVAPEETDYNSFSDVPISMIKEQPYHIELLSPYKACISYREGVVIAVVAGRLMNAATWNEIPLVVSCTLVPRERMSAIVKVHEHIRGAWSGNEWKEEELLGGETLSEHSSQLKHRV